MNQFWPNITLVGTAKSTPPDSSVFRLINQSLHRPIHTGPSNRKQGLISLKIGEISGKKFENVAKPRRKERTALIIPPESFELLATWRSMRKRKERDITY
jgi:hypothetical protein